MIQKLSAKIENIDSYKLALQLTLLNFILKPPGSWEIRAPVLILAVLGLIITNSIRNPFFWLFLTGLTLTWLIIDWPLSDNHAYLLFIWCFAIFLSAYKKDKSILGKNARIMIGCIFLFAFIWKAFLSPDFLDGRFLSINMIEDPRFSEFIQLSCDISSDDLTDIRQYVKQHVDGNLVFEDEFIFNTDCINKVSILLTYYSLTIELIIALLFLLPRKYAVARYRDYFLILFCVSIYSVAAVEGFGWLLIAMGISQSGDTKRVKLLYLLSYLVVLMYGEIPVLNIILSILRKS